MAGSAYGQGSATSFDSTVLSKDVFGILDNTEDELVVAAGQLVAVNTAVGTFSATFTGEGDDDEGGAVWSAGPRAESQATTPFRTPCSVMAA